MSISANALSSRNASTILFIAITVSRRLRDAVSLPMNCAAISWKNGLIQQKNPQIIMFRGLGAVVVNPTPGQAGPARVPPRPRPPRGGVSGGGRGAGRPAPAVKYYVAISRAGIAEHLVRLWIDG